MSSSTPSNNINLMELFADLKFDLNNFWDNSSLVT